MKAVRLLATWLAVATPAVAVAAGDILVHRDPGCGCCAKWVEQMRQQFGARVRMIDDPARAQLQKKRGVPPELSSCHTAIVDNYVVEGHVPIADVKRLVALRPKGVSGIAVPGMPLGSPGMEVAGVAPQRYNVVAFGKSGQSIFARH